MKSIWMTAVLLAAGLAVAEEAGVVQPGDNLIVQGIPPLSKKLAEQHNRYQNVRRARFQDWLPGNGGMLVSTRFAETDQIHLVPSAGARRTQLTFFEDRVSWASACPRKKCGYFLFGMDVGGSEYFQIYRYDLATSRYFMLTDGKSRNTSGVWNRAGKLFAYSSTRRNGRDFDIYLMDPEKAGEQKLLLEVSGMWFPVEFSPDGKTLLVMHLLSINRSHLHLVDVASGKATRLTPDGEREVAYRQAHFSKDGKRIYLTTDRKWEYVRLGYVDLKSTDFDPKWVTSKTEWDVEDFALSQDGKLIALVLNEGGFSKLQVVSTRGHKRLKAPELPPGLIRGLEFQKDGRLLAISIEGSRMPGDVFTYDTKRKKLERWTHSETGGLDVSQLSEPQIIEYPTFDLDGEAKRKIPALLYLPPKRFKPPHPVVISIHGGPESQARPYYLGQGNYNISEMGIVVIRPNVRGSSGYGKNYLLLDNGKLRENAVRDIGELLNWISTRKDLDAGRVGVYGGSYGGFMSLASMVSFSDKLKCGIDYVGISSFVTFLQNTKEYRRDLRRAEYGDERKSSMRFYLEMISPLNNAHKIKVPMLVVQGANDPRVPASESEQIVKKVRDGGGTVWYLQALDEGHGFAKKKNRDYLSLAITRFLQDFLVK